VTSVEWLQNQIDELRRANNILETMLLATFSVWEAEKKGFVVAMSFEGHYAKVHGPTRFIKSISHAKRWLAEDYLRQMGAK